MYYKCRPDIFKRVTSDNGHPQMTISKSAEVSDLSDDDELPPIEANLNRIRPFELHSATETDSDTDSESISQNGEQLTPI